MDFGMPTLVELDSIDDCARLCNSLGLHFVELNMNLPQYQYDAIDIDHFKSVAEKYNVYYTIHLDENLNVSDFNKNVAEAYRRTVMDTIEIARLLNVPVLNMHLSRGVYFTLPDKKLFLFERYKERYLRSIIDFRVECESAIGESNIMLCIENCDGYTDWQEEAIEQFLESPKFALTYDIGHCHSINCKDEPFITSHRDRLHHMHFHDAAGKKNHLVLGTGEIDLTRYLSLAESNNCRVVLETKTANGLKESVKWIKNNYK